MEIIKYMFSQEQFKKTISLYKDIFLILYSFILYNFSLNIFANFIHAKPFSVQFVLLLYVSYKFCQRLNFQPTYGNVELFDTIINYIIIMISIFVACLWNE